MPRSSDAPRTLERNTIILLIQCFHFITRALSQVTGYVEHEELTKVSSSTLTGLLEHVKDES